MNNQLMIRVLSRLMIFRDEIVANDMIVPDWANDSIDEINDALAVSCAHETVLYPTGICEKCGVIILPENATLLQKLNKMTYALQHGEYKEFENARTELTIACNEADELARLTNACSGL